MFQCNEHVEMNKFLCSLACTGMTIIDSQFYIIDSLSLDVSLEWNANLVVNGCKWFCDLGWILNRWLSYEMGFELMIFLYGILISNYVI